MEFLSLDFDDQKKYLTVPGNLLKIKGYISSHKYNIIQSPVDEVMFSFHQIGIMVNSIGGIIGNFFTYCSQPLIYDWGCDQIPREVRETNTKMKKVVDLFVFALSNFLETSTIVLRAGLAAISNLPVVSSEGDDDLFSILGIGDPASILRRQLTLLMLECRETIDDVWENNLEHLSGMMRSLTTTFNTYPSMKAHLSSDWVETLETAMKINLELPDTFRYLSLDIMSEPSLPLSFRIFTRKWYMKEEEDSYSFLDISEICKDTIDIIKRFGSDHSLLPDTVSSIQQLWYMLNEGDQSEELSREQVESLVFQLGTFLKSYGKLSHEVPRNTYKTYCSDVIPLILVKLFSENEELFNTYLVRHVTVCYVSYIQDSKVDCSFAIGELFSHFETVSDFSIYLASLYDKSQLEKMKELFSPGMYRILMEKVNKFSSLDVPEFTDVLTGSFIVVPGVVKNGDSIIWVDTHMMKAYLREKSENPFTRECLTVEEWETYNEEVKDMIKEFDKRRQKVLEE